jgi:hypothetical protein
MKTIIAGSRNISFETTIDYLCEVRFLINITEVISGTARGVDTHGEWFANRYEIPVKQFPANWDEYGKSAGMIRNQEMCDYADALICIWDGVSKGTKQMLSLAKKKKMPIFLLETSPPTETQLSWI